MKDSTQVFTDELKGKMPKRVAQIIPDDGYADGGTPYTDEEMEYMNGNDKGQIKHDIILGLFETIGKGTLNENNGRVPSFEYRDEADPRGTSYIQVYCKDFEETISVERYYESEYAQAEYGETKIVPINFQNPSETQAIVIKVIESISR